jgi:thiamine-phosphate pyrophosphorylase
MLTPRASAALKPLAGCRLYAFVDTAYLRERPPELVARALCDGGADLIQLRAKDTPPDAIRRLAESVLRVTADAGVGLVVNDHPAIAAAVGAPFCHLGQEDFFGAGHTDVAQVQPPGHEIRFGLSTHAPDQARRAVRAGAAYVGVGPVYATGTKPGAKPVTLDYVRWAKAHLTLPWFAIGGINLNNVDDVLEAGARRICVVSAILCARDVARACQAFKDRLASVPL